MYCPYKKAYIARAVGVEHSNGMGVSLQNVVWHFLRASDFDVLAVNTGITNGLECTETRALTIGLVELATGTSQSLKTYL